MVCHGQQICRSLRCGVRARCRERHGLNEEEVRPVERQVAVNFVCSYLMEPLYAVSDRCVHKHLCAEDVRAQKQARIFDRSVYMRLSGKVDDYVKLLLCEESVDRFRVCDIRLYEPEVVIIYCRRECLEIAGVCESVESDDIIVRMSFQHMENKIASDESGCAGNKYLFHLLPSDQSCFSLFQRPYGRTYTQ